MGKEVIKCAAQNGYMNIIKWAIDMGLDKEHEMCYYASWNGHFEICKWGY